MRAKRSVREGSDEAMQTWLVFPRDEDDVDGHGREDHDEADPGLHRIGNHGKDCDYGRQDNVNYRKHLKKITRTW